MSDVERAPGGTTAPDGQTAPGALEPVLAALGRDEVVGVPTDTVYGLAVLPRNPLACAALYELKGRPAALALPVLVAAPDEALELAAATARDTLVRLAGAFWPGPLTVVVPLAPGHGLVVGGDGASVGLRCPGHALLRRLLWRSGPLAVTSANHHGEAPCRTAAEVSGIFDGSLTVLDGGTCDGLPSSVVSLLGEEPELLRAGSVSLEDVRAALT